MEEKKEEDEEGDSVVLRVAPLRRCRVGSGRGEDFLLTRGGKKTPKHFIH